MVRDNRGCLWSTRMKAIKRLTIVLIIVMGLMLSLCLGQGENEQKKMKQEHMDWVGKCLMDFRSIRLVWRGGR